MRKKDEPDRTAWGAGRVAFTARQDTIRLEMAQNHPLTSIYARHKDALGISYTAFVKLVRRYLTDTKPTPRAPKSRTAATIPTPSARPIAAPTLIEQPDPTPSQGQNDARHEPGPRPLPRSFIFDGNPKQDDKDRLIGRRDPKD